jgi:hypothetical protein
MDKAHKVTVLGFRGTVLCLRVDGREYAIEVAQCSRRLAEASPAERAHYEISPAGYGIHWPDLDEDLSIDGLIGVTHGCPRTRTAA